MRQLDNRSHIRPHLGLNSFDMDRSFMKRGFRRKLRTILKRSCSVKHYLEEQEMSVFSDEADVMNRIVP